jgi:hypothetical protein
MDEETWFMDSDQSCFTFRGNNLENAFKNLDENKPYLVIQDWKPIGAMCKHGKVHFANWDGLTSDHSTLTDEDFRARIIEKANTGFEQKFDGPNSSFFDNDTEVLTVLPAPTKPKSHDPSLQ